MKKIFIITIATLLLAQNVMAEFVKPDVAARYAQRVLGMKQAPVAESLPSMRAPGRDSRNSEPEYYIFNNPQGGWAIIAADDRVNPIIGYSHEGTFSVNSLPDNLEWWMEGVASVVADVRKSDIKAPASVQAAWESLMAGRDFVTEGTTKYTETALWSQGEPYNNMCPVASGDNERAVTGCVATAMAIIMQYNSWPAHGNGVIGGYTTKSYPTYIPAYDITNHFYDWDLMSEEVVVKGQTRNWTFDHKDAVAQLIHDCGVAVCMDYSSEGSGSSADAMLKAIQDNMSYSKNSTVVSRSSYSLDEWFSLIKNEIDNGRVVYYDGNGSVGGHAFVCEGYDTEGSKLRINWGWGGGGNGYFTLDLTDATLGLEFNKYQGAVIGLAPDTTSVDAVKTLPVVLMQYRGFYGIEPLVPADMNLGAEFAFYVGWVSGVNPRVTTVDFKVCLEDKDGNVRQEGWPVSFNIEPASSYIYVNETEKTTLNVVPELTDHFRLYIKDSDDKWVPMIGNYDVLPDVEGVTCGVTQDPVIMITGDCAVGNTIDLSLTQGFTHVKSVKWSVNGAVIDDPKVQLVKGKNAIRADVEYIDDTKGAIFRTIELE